MVPGTRKKKVTYTLPEEIVLAVREAVAGGAYGSQAEMVAAALKNELTAARDEFLCREFAKASSDPRFQRDNNQAMSDFRYADEETARMIPE